MRPGRSPWCRPSAARRGGRSIRARLQAVDASGSHNLPVITGVAFCFTVVVVVANLLVDLSYRWLNPKVRTR